MKGIRIAAFVLGLIIFVVLFVIILFITRLQSGESNKQEIIVAARDIAEMTVVTSDMLTTKEVGIETIDQNTLFDKEEAVGKVANTKIFAGEAISGKKLSSTDNSQLGIAPEIASGMRAVSILVDPGTGVSGLLRSGNFVDVVLTFDPAAESSTPANTLVYGSAKSIMIAQNAKVIALNQVDNVAKQAQNAEANDVTEVYITVTLEVTPEQAMSIALGESTESSKIVLLLRSQGDKGNLDLPGRNL